MSTTPTRFVLPTQPASYGWEATNEGVAARYGLPLEAVVRFDLNTPPEPPEWLSELLAGGRFQTDLADYPPGDYRELTEAASAVYGVPVEWIAVAAGADEALDVIAKATLPPGGRAVLPAPSYAMYRVITEQRPATVVEVPRLGAAHGRCLDPGATRAAAASADLVWLCDPNNPSGVPEPDGVLEGLLDGIAADAAAAGRTPPTVVLDEAYAEFVGRTRIPLLERHPNLVIVRTASKAYALASFRVGFAIAGPALAARLAIYRAPGSVTTISATVATEALRRQASMRARVERLLAEAGRFRAALRADGWRVGESATNFLLLDLGSRERASTVAEHLLRHGLVPRTFGEAHPLADHLRLTVRDEASDDRLVEALRSVPVEGRRGA